MEIGGICNIRQVGGNGIIERSIGLENYAL
jgi:hypothetical protein